MILIMASSNDPAATWIYELIREQGHECCIVDFSRFPSEGGLVVKYNTTTGPTSLYMQPEGHAISLEKVKSIFWWRPATPIASAEIIDTELRSLIESSSAEVILSVFDQLECLHFPCSRHALKQAHYKLPQLTLASRLGFNIPETIITNNPDEFLDFCNKSSKLIITKPASALTTSIYRSTAFGYADIVSKRDLVHYQDARHCPFIAQTYIEKRVEVRATVVGNDVYSAEIHSQITNRTKFDWRHYDDGNTPYFAHNLPDEIAQKCIELVKSMGLHYGAIDLILTPDGDYYFLEINPAGQFGWIEDRTGLPISKRIVKLLVEHI